MSLPADGVNANALTETTTIPTGKKLIFLDPDTNEGGIITLENLTKQILSNLATQTFNLDQGTKTLPAALNELNSKAFELKKHVVTKGNLIESFSGPELLNESIDTGFKISNKILPLRFECTDRAGWMPVVWTYPTFSENYLIYFGEGAQGEFQGTLYYIEIK